jgi:hypothetical protein
VATTQDDLFVELSRFSKLWVAHGWSWDGRLNCVASTFSHAHVDEAHGLVEGVFPERWTDTTVANAPSVVNAMATATGGVRSDQMLYSAPPIDGLVLYGLWWPWGAGGTSISMRIGLTGRSSDAHTMRLRTAFRALE